MKSLHLLFVAKAVALSGGGWFFYSQYHSKAQGQETPVTAESSKATASNKIPDIPEQGLSLSKASELRNQLLLMRKDVEQKTENLNVARQAYERSKADVDNKLKRIEEERKLLEETLHKEKKAKTERLSEALEFVSKMEPKKAAPLLEGMDRDLVLQLLRKLPPRQVTKLLEAVNPKKATEFLEYYTRIRSGREFELFRELGLCQSTGGQEGDNEKPDNEKDASTQPAVPGTGKPASAAPAEKPAVASGASVPDAAKGSGSAPTPSSDSRTGTDAAKPSDRAEAGGTPTTL